MIRRPPRSTQSRSSAASDVYKRQEDARFKEQGRRDEQTCHGTGVKGKFRILIAFPGHWFEHSSLATVCERVEERKFRLWHIVAYRAEVRPHAVRFANSYEVLQ